MSNGAKNSEHLNTVEQVKQWLILELAARLEIEAVSIDIHERFSGYNLDSANATGLVAKLSETLGRTLPATLMWDHPTIAELARFLIEGDIENPALTVGADFRGAHYNEPIAIIGMSCRFPGGAVSLDEYWRLLCEGFDAIGEVPESRWDINNYYDPDPSAPGKINTRLGGFLEHVDRFDPQFFGISPREAVVMDPQQRITLELTWEALEDAGIPPHSLRDSLTGVFMGNMFSDYSRLNKGDVDQIAQHSGTGQDSSIISARISYALGLSGPSFTVNTACSSSLVAVHLACQSLRNGESTLGIVGGVNLIISPESSVAMAKFGGLSPDGHCYTFDSRANGYARGEGGGVVILKPLSRALAQGDPVYCVIRGSAVNNDGYSNGLTAPNPRAQQAVLKQAYSRAGISGSDVHYVECHGTGTQLGDPIETGALGAVLGRNRDPEQPLVIGSVKSNMGHLEAAAGMSGLIKAVLAIRHRKIPPSINFDVPNPHINFEQLKLRVQKELGPWPSNEPAIAGISSFGFGGTNSHVVIQELSVSPLMLLPLSAENPKSLRALVEKYQDFIDSEEATEHKLSNLCYTGAMQLSRNSERISFTAESGAELSKKMSDYLREDNVIPSVSREAGPVFVFSGNGSPWEGMGLSLIQNEPVFRAKLYQCDRALTGLADWSILELLKGDRLDLNNVALMWPVICAFQIGLVALWKSWGIEPSMVIGHSTGEIAAAHAAGNLTLEDAMRIAFHCGRLIDRTAGQGGMVLIDLSQEATEEALKKSRNEKNIFIAGCNAPESTVVSGEPAVLQEFITYLQKKEVRCRTVRVNVAYHSPQMEPLQDEMRESLQSIRPFRGEIEMVSTVTADFIDGTKCGVEYWIKNVREPVLFTQSIDLILEKGHQLFLEISPHPIMSRSIKDQLKIRKKNGLVLHTIKRDEDEWTEMLGTLGKLYELGSTIRWPPLFSSENKLVELPTPLQEYVLWDRRESPASRDESNVEAATPSGGKRASDRAYLITLSGHTPNAMYDLADKLLEQVTNDPSLFLKDLCYSSNLRRHHHDHRVALLARNREGLEVLLGFFAEREGSNTPNMISEHVKHGHTFKTVFNFTGQGSQWFGMGQQLMEQEPVFRQKMEECDEIFSKLSGWSVLAELYHDKEEHRLSDTEVAQPAIFMLETALVALLEYWGVIPEAVMGHSVGEVIAAHVAGVFNLEEAIFIIYHRSRHMQKATGTGRMAAVSISPEEADSRLEGFGGRLSVGVYNGPASIVVSGEESAVEEYLKPFEGTAIYHKMLPVNYAFHSAQMEPFRADLVESLKDIKPRTGRIPVYSTVTGDVLKGPEMDAEHWGQNVRGAVLFTQAMDKLIDDGYNVFLEVGAHPALAHSILQCLDHRGTSASVFPCLRREKIERVAMLRTLGNLYAIGYPVNLDSLHSEGGRLVTLPSYPWQHQSYWVEPPKKPKATVYGRSQDNQFSHPLLGDRLSLPLPTFDTEVSAQANLQFGEFRPYGRALLPETGLLEMAMLAATESMKEGHTFRLSNVKFQHPVILNRAMVRTFQTIVNPELSFFQIFSLNEDNPEHPKWNSHTSGKIVDLLEYAAARPRETMEAIRERCNQPTEIQEYLDVLYTYDSSGLDWLNKTCMIGDNELLLAANINSNYKNSTEMLHLYPEYISLCLAFLKIMRKTDPGLLEIFSLERIKHFAVYGPVQGDVWFHLELKRKHEWDAYPEGSISIFNDKNELLVEIRGITFRILKHELFDILSQYDLEESVETVVSVVEGSASFVSELQEMSSEKRYEALLDYIQGAISRVLMLDDSSPFDTSRGFFQLGMDSLMAVNLRKQLEKKLDRVLPTTVTFEYSSVEALAGFLSEEITVRETKSQAASEPVAASTLSNSAFAGISPNNAHAIPDNIDDLSEDELTILLARELEDLKGNKL